MLERARYGIAKYEDYLLLKGRFFNDHKNEEKFKACVECYYYNKEVREANRSKLIECRDVFLNKARDLEFEKPIETKYDCCVDTALEYGIDLRVMLTTNLCPAKGLANGV